jgi:ankyrin repeat protein
MACGKKPEEARKELAAMNIQYNAEEFCKAISNGDVTVVRLFLDSGMSPNVMGYYKDEFPSTDNKRTALEIALRSHRDDISLLLIERGADVNLRTRPMSPLYNAILNLHNKKEAKTEMDPVVLALLDKGADLNAGYNDWTSPLMVASGGGYIPLVKELIRRGVDVNWTADGGASALMVAKKTNKEEVVQILKQAGAREK